MRTDAQVLQDLEPLLYGWHHEGIRAAGAAYPLGGFLLVAATIDVLAGLAENPPNDNDRRRGERYRRFVQRFFPAQYARLPTALWDGLRSAPMHYFQAKDLLFADGQPEHRLHLDRDPHGRVILHWPEFLGDYEAARERYAAALKTDAGLMENARQRLQRRPLITVIEVERRTDFPTPLPVHLPTGATAMAAPLASGSPGPAP
jgi:hypothetical protein